MVHCMHVWHAGAHRAPWVTTKGNLSMREILVLVMTSLSVHPYTPQVNQCEWYSSRRKLLFNKQHIINSFIANTSHKDRVFFCFNRLCAPCGSRDSIFFLYLTLQIRARQCMLKIIQFHELYLQTDYSSVDGAS